jgi:hypothetical protein
LYIVNGLLVKRELKGVLKFIEIEICTPLYQTSDVPRKFFKGRGGSPCRKTVFRLAKLDLPEPLRLLYFSGAGEPIPLWIRPCQERSVLPPPLYDRLTAFYIKFTE